MEKINDKLIFVPFECIDRVQLEGWNGGAFDTRNGYYGMYFYKD